MDATLDDVLELGPDRLSVFSYARMPWVKPAQRIFGQRGQLPGAEEKLAQFALMQARLLTAGYVDIGLDHFARPGDELAQARAAGTLQRNFQGYSTRAGRLLYGLGLSSISQTPDMCRQNTKSLFEYRAALAAGRLPVERGYRLTAEDKRRRVLVMGLMGKRWLDFAALRDRHGIDAPRDYAAELASLDVVVADGLVRVGCGRGGGVTGHRGVVAGRDDVFRRDVVERRVATRVSRLIGPGGGAGGEGGAVGGGEEGGAGHEGIGPGGGAEGTGGEVHAAIDFEAEGEVALGAPGGELAEFGQHGFAEGLAAETGLHGHDEHEVNFGKEGLDGSNGGAGVEHDTALAAPGADLAEEGAVIVGGLDVDADEIGAGFGEGLGVVAGVAEHEVGVEKEVGEKGAEGGYRLRAEAEVGHEMAVHDIDVEPG